MKRSFAGIDVVLILEIVVASIAVVLILLSLRTLQAIKHLGVGKSFWTPVAVSGFLFFFGSVVAILFELNLSLTAYTDEVVQISRLLALSILVSGIYSYSRKVSKNLGEKFTLPKRVAKTDIEAETDAAPAAPEPPPIQERLVEESSREETAPQCRHRFGYLRTLPRDASIPDECLSCGKIIECKHALANTIKSHTS